MRFRVRYEHEQDGAGEVTRWQGHPLEDVQVARDVLASLCSNEEYRSLELQRQSRPGSRWEIVAADLEPMQRRPRPDSDGRS